MTRVGTQIHRDRDRGHQRHLDNHITDRPLHQSFSLDEHNPKTYNSATNNVKMDVLQGISIMEEVNGLEFCEMDP
jgi:hypothetical protein